MQGANGVNPKRALISGAEADDDPGRKASRKRIRLFEIRE
jgi:hypothetical protein